MRLAVVTEFFAAPGRPPFGGVDTRAREILVRLAERHDVHVVASRQPGDPPEEQAGGIRIHRVGTVRPFTQRGHLLARLRFQRAAAAAARALAPDAVEGSGFVAYAPARAAARRLGVPCLLTVHEVWQGEWRRNMGALQGLYGTAAERRILRDPSLRLIAVSKATAERLTPFRPGGDGVAVVPNGAAVRVAAGAWGPEAPPRLLGVGRLVAYKRYDLAIRTVAALAAEFPGLSLDVVGHGPVEEELAKLARAIGAQVRFRGRVGDGELARLWQGCAGLVHPSPVEGFSLVVAEAMASGVPYVAADVPAVRETTAGGLGGRLCRPGDLADLVAKVRIMLRDGLPDRRGLEHSLRHHSWGATASAYEAAVAGFVSSFPGTSASSGG